MFERHEKITIFEPRYLNNYNIIFDQFNILICYLIEKINNFFDNVQRVIVLSAIFLIRIDDQIRGTKKFHIKIFGNDLICLQPYIYSHYPI